MNRLLIGLCITAGIPFAVLAIAENPVSAYRLMGTAQVPTSKVPTVVEIPLPGTETRDEVLVMESGENTFVPSLVLRQSLLPETTYTITGTLPTSGTLLEDMLDGRTATFAEFPVPEGATGAVALTLRSSKPVTASSLRILLDANVALPKSITLRIATPSGVKLVLENAKINSEMVGFPSVTATEWQITFTYSQLLRISELHIDNEREQSNTRTLRFLALPGKSYVVYLDPDRYAPATLGESGNLMSSEGILKLPELATFANSAYRPADTDQDGIMDMRDNCVGVSNVDQTDTDGNDRGDACDDFDRDGVLNNIDNCPNIPNRAQADDDGDKIGDVCDAEESRVTEKYPWLPWVGMGTAALVLLALVFGTIYTKKKEGLPPIEPPTNS